MCNFFASKCQWGKSRRVFAVICSSWVKLPLIIVGISIIHWVCICFIKRWPVPEQRLEEWAAHLKLYQRCACWKLLLIKIEWLSRNFSTLNSPKVNIISRTKNFFVIDILSEGFSKGIQKIILHFIAVCEAATFEPVLLIVL